MSRTHPPIARPTAAQTFHRDQGRAGRRRLSHRLDQSGQPEHYPAGLRPGRDYQRELRRPPGAPGTTSPPRSFITSSPTINFLITCTAANRKAVRWVRRAAATMAQITFREWHPVGAEEYAYVAPDPLNPNIIYGGGRGGVSAATTVSRAKSKILRRRAATVRCAQRRCCFLPWISTCCISVHR